MDESDLAEIKKQIADLQQQLSKRSSDLKCSFCGLKEPQVKKLIAGPGVYICNECVYLCNEILDDELFEGKGQSAEELHVSQPCPEPDPLEIAKLKKADLRRQLNQISKHKCSVCGKSQDKVRKLVPCSAGNICDECVSKQKAQQNCSYCGKQEIQGISAGPGIYICVECSNLRKCSFCGKRETLVKKLITGPGVYICDECVALCNEIRDERSQQSTDRPAVQAPERNVHDDRFDCAKNELLQTVLRESDKWIISKIADNSVGVQVLLGAKILGADLEEQVLFASALQTLVEERLLLECHHENTETTYQVSWKGILKARIFQADRSTDAVLEPGLYQLETAKTELLKDVLRGSAKWTIKQTMDRSEGVKLLVAEKLLGANVEEQVLFASALETAVAQGLLVQSHHEHNETTFQLTWKGFLKARTEMQQGIDCYDQKPSKTKPINTNLEE